MRKLIWILLFLPMGCREPKIKLSGLSEEAEKISLQACSDIGMKPDEFGNFYKDDDGEIRFYIKCVGK